MQKDGCITISMHEYIQKLDCHRIPRNVDFERELTDQETHQYKSLLAKARWPIAKLVPQLAYGISAFSQKDPKGRILTDRRVFEGPTQCNLVEFQSNTISRVVGSTMAAESASMSVALDRQLYLRLMVESILEGEPKLIGGSDWRASLKIPGVLVTDAKSLFDHMSKIGTIPISRQTLIYLLVARDLIEAKSIELKWLPNTNI